MKIATITCYNYMNHGAALQSLALTSWLRAQGHDVEMIDYRPPYLFKDHPVIYRTSTLKDFAKMILRMRENADSSKRHRAHLRFAAEKLPLTAEKYTDFAQLASFPGADAIVAGSDQIWNTDFPNGTDPAFYLRFGPGHTRRISYAASFAVADVPANKRDTVGGWIRDLDAVSVRETSAIDILHTMNCDGTRVCDPVFLLPPAFWHNQSDGTGHDERYLLVYDFFGDPALRHAAVEIARRRGLKIYSASERRLPYARNFSSHGPETFLSLIANAEYVVNNSFHATAFSLIFNKDFLVVKRPDGLNLRMLDLAERYGLADRITDGSVPDSAVDYSAVQPLMDADIAASQAWLKREIAGA